MNNKENQNIQLKTSNPLLCFPQAITRLGRATSALLVYNCILDITVLGMSPVKESGSILNLKRAYSSRSSSRSGNETLTNEVKVRQDVLRELMVPVCQSTPRAEGGGETYGQYSK